MVDVYDPRAAEVNSPRPGGASVGPPPAPEVVLELEAQRFVASLRVGDAVEVTWEDGTTAWYDVERSRIADNNSPLRVRGRRTDTTQHLDVFALMLAKMAVSYVLRADSEGPLQGKQEVVPEVQPPPKPGVTRAKVLDLAGQAVLQDRTVTHGGNLEQSFAAIAAHWSILFGVDVAPWQVPLAMNLLKIVRANHNPKHLDNWTDQAGYAACGAELASGPEL